MKTVLPKSKFPTLMDFKTSWLLRIGLKSIESQTGDVSSAYSISNQKYLNIYDSSFPVTVQRHWIVGLANEGMTPDPRIYTCQNFN